MDFTRAALTASRYASIDAWSSIDVDARACDVLRGREKGHEIFLVSLLRANASEGARESRKFVREGARSLTHAALRVASIDSIRSIDRPWRRFSGACAG